MEMLNRYTDGARKRDPTTDLRGIENSDAEYREGSVTEVSREAQSAPATTECAGSCIVASFAVQTLATTGQEPLMMRGFDGSRPQRQPANRTGQLQSALAMCGSEIANAEKALVER